MPRPIVNYENLRVEMARKNISMSDISKAIEKKRSAVSDRLSRKRAVSLQEAFKIQSILFPECDVDYLFAEDRDNKGA